MSDIIKELEAVEKWKNKKKVQFNEPDFVEIFTDNKENLPIYYDKNSYWWVWNEKQSKWEYTDETDVLLIIQDEYPTLFLHKSKIRQEVLNALKLVFRKREIITPPIEWIQFRNKILDVKTNQEIQLDKKYFFTNPIPHEIGETDETPRIDELITSWVGKDRLKLLYEIIAYTFIRDYPIHRIFCFTGTGRNGKSQYLGIINKLLGDDNTSTTDLDLLMSRPFESFKLYKKLVCQMGETNYEGLKRTAILKQLTGKDLISFERKGKDGFSDYNYAKLLISTNGIPITHDKSDGFYRRWLIIDFPNNFPEGTDIINTIPQEEYNNLCNKCIKLLPQILERGGFDNEPSIEEKKEIYETKSNPLKLYISQFMIQDFSGFVGKTEMFNKFSAWLNENGYRSINYSEFSGLMKLNYDDGQKGEEKTRCWIGLRYLNKDEILQNSLRGNRDDKKSYRGEVTQVTEVTHFSSPFYMRENQQENSVTSVTSVTASVENTILSSIKTMLLLKEELKEQELLTNLRNLVTFEYRNFSNCIEKLKEVGEIMENPKGTFRRL